MRILPRKRSGRKDPVKAHTCDLGESRVTERSPCFQHGGSEAIHLSQTKQLLRRKEISIGGSITNNTYCARKKVPCQDQVLFDAEPNFFKQSASNVRSRLFSSSPYKKRHGRSQNPRPQRVAFPPRNVAKRFGKTNENFCKIHRRPATTYRIQYKKAVYNSVEPAQSVPNNTEGQQSIETGEEREAHEARLVPPEMSSSNLKRNLQTSETEYTNEVSQKRGLVKSRCLSRSW